MYPLCVDISFVPSERYAIVGVVVGSTSRRHLESEIRKKVEFAPESETTVHGKGVLGDKGGRISIELIKLVDMKPPDEGSPNTRASYLMGRSHLDILPPAGLDAVALAT